jgi:hypothetical protein
VFKVAHYRKWLPAFSHQLSAEAPELRENCAQRPMADIRAYKQKRTPGTQVCASFMNLPD